MKIIISYPPLQGPGSPMLTQNRQFQWYNVPSYIYPLVSAMAATLLEKEGFEVIWNDCIAQNWDYQQFLDFIQKEKPDLVAIETKTPVIKQHWKIINDIKKGTVKRKEDLRDSPHSGTVKRKEDLRDSPHSGTVPIIVLCGDHVTALPEESFKNSQVDFVLTGGDYDFLLLSLCNYLDARRLPCRQAGKTQNAQLGLESGIYYRDNGQVKNTGQFQLNHDLNTLPFIDRQLTNAYLYGEKWKRYTPFFYTYAGRDCWWKKCSFCAWTIMYPKFRCRSPQNLLDEIGFLIEQYGAREIFDDTGTFPSGEWLEEFCQGLINRGFHKKIIFSCNMNFQGISQNTVRLMKRANFRKLKMGLESANQSTLDRLNKGISIEEVIEKCRMITNEGLEIHLTIMVGYPWETKTEALNTLELANRLMQKGWIQMLQATVLVPYPGTGLFQEGIQNNWFRFSPQDYERFDMSEPVFKTPDMSPEETMAFCRRTYRTFLSPRFMLRNLMKMRSLNDFKYNLRGLTAVRGHIRDFK